MWAKSVAITGAASGIGKELVKICLDHHMTVWAIDVSEQGLATLATEHKAQRAKLKCITLDVRNREDIMRCVDEIFKESPHGLDVWINNAGVSGIGDFARTTEENFDAVLAINLHAVIDATRVVLRHMEERGRGAIVNMASIAGHVPAPFMTAYCATKHGVVGFTRALQAELEMRASPINVILVSPGFVETAIINKGANVGFPEWMSFALAEPARVAREIFQAIAKKKLEIFPTVNGKLMLGSFRLFPKATVRSSKALLTKSFKDYVFNRFNVP